MIPRLNQFVCIALLSSLLASILIAGCGSNGPEPAPVDTSKIKQLPANMASNSSSAGTK